MVLNNAIMDGITTSNVGAAMARFMVEPSDINFDSIKAACGRYATTWNEANQDLKDRLRRLHDYEYNG